MKSQWKPPKVHYTSTTLKTWTYEGKTFQAWRDQDGYITIAYRYPDWKEDQWFGWGNAGYDYCFREEDIPALAKRLGCPISE